MRDDNYPDDIRQYDDNPRSPFFVDRLEIKKDVWINELESDPEYLQEAYGDFDEEYRHLCKLLHHLFFTDITPDERIDILAEIRENVDSVLEQYADKKVEHGELPPGVYDD